MPFHYVEGGWWYMQRGGTISTSVSAAQPVAMGRFYPTPILLLFTLLSIVTSQGDQQQFRSPRLRQQQQQSEIRNVGSQQVGRFRGTRGPRLRQPIISVSPEEQALAGSFNFNIPFRTPADFVRAPGRFARALWDIEVGQ